MKNILALLYTTLFMISCSSGFNPRYYYEKSKRGGLSSSPVIKPVEAPTEVEADKDPFKVGEWNDINYGGYDGKVFDSWLFKASFQSDKLPIYNFLTNDTRHWIPGGKDWNNISPANYYNPKDKENEASCYGITGSTIYKYDGANPLYDNTGYLPGRIDRFRFYSLYGKAVIVDLQQYLIAVDTYSKLVFAFGKITETKSTFGEKVPMKFEAIEYHGDKDFYEYDPIGYVDKDGKVILYEHYRTEFVKNPTGYLPKQHGFEQMASHSKTGQGHSPYTVLLDVDVGENDIQKFYDNISSLVNKDFNWRDYSGYDSTSPGGKGQIDLNDWKSSGYAGKSLILYTYKITDSGNKFVISETDFDTKKVASKYYSLDKITASNKATYTNANGESLSIRIEENDSQKTISLGAKELDPNFVDYGPIFTDRIRNKFFKRDGKLSIGGSIGGSIASTFPLGQGNNLGSLQDLQYKFNEDGTEFTMKYSYDEKVIGTKWVEVEYKFKLLRFYKDSDKHWTAEYECLNPPKSGFGGNHTRVVLRNGEGTSNPGPNEVGNIIRSSMTLYGDTMTETPTSNSGLEMIANLQN